MVHATLGIPAPTRAGQEGRCGRRPLASGGEAGRRLKGIKIQPEAPPNRRDARSSSAAVIAMLQSLNFEFGRSPGSFGGRSLGFVCLRSLGFVWLQLGASVLAALRRDRWLLASRRVDPRPAISRAILSIFPEAGGRWADCAPFQDILPRIGFLSKRCAPLRHGGPGTRSGHSRTGMARGFAPRAERLYSLL